MFFMNKNESSKYQFNKLIIKNVHDHFEND